MNNPTAQQTPITSDGLSSSTRSAKAAKTTAPDVDDKREVVSDFLAKVASAKARAQAEKTKVAPWVETTPEIIAHFNPRGLGGAKYFTYDGVIVCERGQREAIQAELAKTLAEKLHGPQEGVSSFRG